MGSCARRPWATARTRRRVRTLYGTFTGGPTRPTSWGRENRWSPRGPPPGGPPRANRDPRDGLTPSGNPRLAARGGRGYTPDSDGTARSVLRLGSGKRVRGAQGTPAGTRCRAGVSVLQGADAPRCERLPALPPRVTGVGVPRRRLVDDRRRWQRDVVRRSATRLERRRRHRSSPA